MKFRFWVKYRTEGEIMPPWYYGLAYIDFWHMGRDIFYPIPINYIVRARRLIGYIWHKIRTRRDILDKIVLKRVWRKCENCYYRSEFLRREWTPEKAARDQGSLKADGEGSGIEKPK